MQTIGERLEEARKRKGVSLREAAEATKVRGDYLQKFENNQFDIGLTEIYVRGFLRNYATYLKLPADRMLGDYAALGHGQPKSRQPSREVYGRMDLSISGGDERAGSPEAAPAPAPHVPHPHGPDAPRPSPVPPTRVGHSGGVTDNAAMNQKVIFVGLIAAAGVVALLLIIWIVKSLVGGSSARPAERSVPPSSAAPAADLNGSSVGFYAVRPVQLTVRQQPDGSDLAGSGELQAGETREFPNTDLYLTTNAIQDIQLEYKGAHYQIGTGNLSGPKQNLHLAPMR